MLPVFEYIFERSKKDYIYALSRAVLQERETMGLLKAFHENGIAAVPLKGPFLSKRLYADIAKRGLSADIDLLVEIKNREKARALLEKMGYAFSLQGAEDREKLWQDLYTKNGSALIDLHWQITPFSFYENRMEEFWRGRRPVKEGDVFFYELKEEEQLIYIAANFADSGRLIEQKHLFDINEILKKYKNELNWPDIINKAKRWRLARSLYTALSFSRELLDSNVPEEVLSELKPLFPKRIFIRIFANRRVLLSKNSRRRRLIERFLWYLLPQLLEAGSPKEYFEILFPPREKMDKKSYFRRLARSALRFIKAFG